MSLHHGLRSAAGASVADPDFENVSLLLLGNGSNGGQNNSFVDGSSNAFSVTRYGNTTQGTFSPFGYNWSNYFATHSDYLSIANSSAFDFGTGDFTIEGWVFPIVAGDSGQGGVILARWTIGPGTGTDFIFYINNPNTLGFTANNSAIAITASTTIPLNSWSHVAIVRSGNTFTLYQNGSSVGTTTSSAAITYTSGQPVKTCIWDYSGSYLKGNLSNIRVLKGTAQYSGSTYTVPTAPLTAITNTSLLTCQSNRFIDNSSNAFTITPYGDAAVTNFAPFPTNTEYSTGTNGGSGWFDGNGDYLGFGSTSSLNFMHNTTALFTVEFWIYRTTNTASAQLIISTNDGASANIGASIYLSSGAVGLYITRGVYGSTNAVIDAISSGTAALNAWTHIAVTYDQSLSSNNVKFYINGTLDTQATKYSNTPSNSNATYSPTVCGSSSGGSVFTGYVSSLRITNSIAYSSNFTPSTSPLTAITNTSLLLNFTNAAIIDSTGKNDLETVGDAQISTSTKKFGTGSLKFDGTGDYLAGIMNASLAFGSGDMTIECWINPSTVSGLDTIFDTRVSGAFGNDAFTLYLDGGVVKAYAGSVSGELILAGTSAVSTSTWTHIAFTRSGTTNRIFVDGTQQASNTTSWNQTFTSTNLFYIGQTQGINRPFDGYIDDLRISKVCRYSSAFTPPTRQLPAR